MKKNSIDNLINAITKLPAIGKKSATRIALNMLGDRHGIMLPILKAIDEANKNIKECDICGNYDDTSPCHICCNETRDKKLITVIEGVSDLWVMESGGFFYGKYHVLGGVLSAIDGIGPEELRLDKLRQRIIDEGVVELIIATNATMEGETTAHYIISNCTDIEGLNITRLATGIPIGGEIEYLDEGTLATAYNSRRRV